MFLGRDKGWWQEKALLFLFLMIGGFLIAPNGQRKAVMCGLGFSSYCETQAETPKAPDMAVGEVRYIDGIRIERTK